MNTPENIQQPANTAHESVKYPEDMQFSNHTRHELVERPENIQNSDYTEHEFAEHPEYSQITGTFREQANANQAIQELRQLGFQDVQLTEYNPTTADEEGDTPLYADDIRFFVHVRAEGKEQEAVGVLVKYGSNNSDLPRGFELANGRLARIGAAEMEQRTPTHGAPDSSSSTASSRADDLVKERYNP